jgi:hypothetical protein
MIDMGQHDAIKTVTGLPDEKVFSNHPFVRSLARYQAEVTA